MGMDMYIEAVKYNPVTKETDREEVCYWRKFWDLHDALGLYGDGDYNKDVRLTKRDVERVLDFVTHHRDYFGSFDTVPNVCELLANYDEITAEGWEIVYNANW